LNTEYNDLQRKLEMNNKLIKSDTKIKEKIKDLEIKRDEQEKYSMAILNH
jgi:hypothetical protein